MESMAMDMEAPPSHHHHHHHHHPLLLPPPPRHHLPDPHLSSPSAHVSSSACDFFDDDDDDHHNHPPVVSVAQIKLSLSSRLHALRKHEDLAYSSLMNEVRSASSRLSKRLKVELQSCAQQIQMLDQNLTDFKEGLSEIQKECEELACKSQKTTSQYTTKMLPGLIESVEKDMEKLRTLHFSLQLDK